MIRHIIGVTALSIAVATPLVGANESSTTPQAETTTQQKAIAARKQTTKCKSLYTRRVFHKTARRAYGRYGISAHETKTIRRLVRCQYLEKSERIVRRAVPKYKEKYRSKFFWEIRWSRVPNGLKARLANLRACESTNNPRATNGSHWGYYQYDVRTWGEAQSAAKVPYSRRTIRADYASPLHQNVATAAFFPGHTGRWACSA